MTTLGCPKWDIETVFTRASDYGFDGVDFRGLQENLDITRQPEFTSEMDQTRRLLDEAGLSVSALSSSIEICNSDSSEENVSRARRLLPIAHGLDVEYIRVFGKGDSDTQSDSEMARTGRTTMEQILSLEGATDVQWIVETHDNWTQSEDCRVLVDRVDSPNVSVLWDVGHTARTGSESPAETLETLGSSIEYVHIKDAVYEPDHEYAMDDGWRYVAPGTGELPLAETIQLLRRVCFDGWVLFEHEKRWHPELQDPEHAYPAFVDWFKNLSRGR
ncbi:sugar phosphate isomerase/epimerase family protein [Halorarum halophilum]|nr:sugar phosphate isomerase/epimerase [Halobaculum halophilum]